VIRAYAALRTREAVVLVLACRAKTARARGHELRLRALAAELRVADSTHFVGEIAAIHGLLGAADVVALPADTLYAKMDLPLVLIEAMMLGRAVITAQGTAAAELAQDDAALAVAPNVGAVTAALGGLLESRAERLRLGERARRAALARYHPTIMASAYETVYDELLS
jgi:phosphatidylinositol alpha-1,6-mannosyltransferase